MKKISQFIENKIINEDSEIVNVNTSTIYVEREPDYIKLYISDLFRLNDIPRASNSILFEILKRMTFNNDIALFAPVKREIARELSCSEVTIKKAIELFTEKGLLIRKDRGLYILNPNVFGKGKWENIKKIRLSLEYSADGRVVQTEISE